MASAPVDGPINDQVSRESLPEPDDQRTCSDHPDYTARREYGIATGILGATPSTASERLIHAYREHPERVRGLAAATVGRHAVLAGDFLRFLRYDDDLERLSQVQASDLEAFVVQASTRVGRITMQKVIAILRSFLRFLAVSGEIPDGRPVHELIHTCELNEVNAFDYLTELLRHTEELKQNPSEWMPWNYRDTLARLAMPAAA